MHEYAARDGNACGVKVESASRSSLANIATFLEEIAKKSDEHASWTFHRSSTSTVGQAVQENFYIAGEPLSVM